MEVTDITDEKVDINKSDTERGIHVAIYKKKPVNWRLEDFTFIYCELTDEPYSNDRIVPIPKYEDKEIVGLVYITDMSRNEFFNLSYHAKLHALHICWYSRAGCYYEYGNEADICELYGCSCEIVSKEFASDE